MTTQIETAQEGLHLSYHSNNSGGGWWINDDGWNKLDATSWVVGWATETRADYSGLRDGRYMGALAVEAYRPLADKSKDTIQAALDEWETATGQNMYDEGCNCCGEPHGFTVYDGDSYVSSVETRRTVVEYDWDI